MTTVADGLFQYGGMPVGNSLLSNKIFSTSRKGRAWFVDTAYGGNGDGKSPKTAFSTMARAFAAVASGDIIYFVGKVTEQLVTPVDVFDVTIVGAGNRPRHADSTPVSGNYAASQWGAPATGGTAAQATVRVLQQGWRFVNILFTAIDTNAAMIELVRNAASGDAERDASHCEIIGCRFAGAGIGVGIGAASFTELLFNVSIKDCTFSGLTTGIGGVGQLNEAQIIGNRFIQNTNHIKVSAEGSVISDNILAGFTTKGIDLSGGIGTDANIVTKNYLSGTYSVVGGYTVHNAADEWAGNFNTLTGGITVADPA